MPDMSAGVSTQAAEVNAINMKIAVDDQYNNQREQFSRGRAWEDLALRRAHNNEAFDFFVKMTTAGSTATAQQTGQDTTATAGGAETAADADATLTNVTSQLSDLTTQVATLAATLNAFLAQQITNAGNASAPKS